MMIAIILVSRAHCGAECRCAEPGPEPTELDPASAVHHYVSHRVRETDLAR
jgi:hypothetical protein